MKQVRNLILMVVLVLGFAMPLKPVFAQDPGDAAAAAAAGEATKELLPQLIDGSKNAVSWAFKRSVVVTFENNTPLSLEMTGNDHSSGAFGNMLPYPRLAANGATVFNSHTTGFMRGTIGWVEYWTPDGSLGVHLNWANPWAGHNHCEAQTLGPLADNYMVITSCGGGNRGAMMGFNLIAR